MLREDYLIYLLIPFGLLVLFSSLCFANPLEPDEIIFRDGKVLHGLIIEQNAESITFQTSEGETKILRQDISRVRDNDGLENLYTRVPERNSLPDWRVIINDIRLADSVRKFDQIPATTISEGIFRNVPYRSFRANNFYELNIYGDPENPAGIEIGIYGFRKHFPVFQKHCRDFLSSYLTSVKQLNAVYAINPKGESRKVGSMVIETTSPGAPDAEGAWWISLYNENQIEEVRLSDEEYAKLTVPKSVVMANNGKLNPFSWLREELKEIRRRNNTDHVLVRGFSKGKDGRFRLDMSE